MKSGVKNSQEALNIGLRCGINTGNVFYGNFGTPRNDQLTAMGSEVHIASRLQSLILEDESHTQIGYLFPEPLNLG